jgi:pimeloyl-ACP methyl ester carboxylesterase
MGSFVARRAAVRAPDRVRRLVLVGAGPSSRNEALLEVQNGAMALRDPVDRGFVRDFQYSTVHQPVPSEFMDTAIAESLTLDAATWQAVIAGLLAYTPVESDIRAPTLVLGGDKDAVFSVHEQRELARRIDGATVEILEGLGHAPHWEDPTRFVATLLGFLQFS